MIPPVNEHAAELARFLSASEAGGETALARQMTTTSRDRALAAALGNSGHPARCGQCRRSSRPAWVATRVAASPPKARAALYGGAATPLRPHRL